MVNFAWPYCTKPICSNYWDSKAFLSGISKFRKWTGLDIIILAIKKLLIKNCLYHMVYGLYAAKNVHFYYLKGFIKHWFLTVFLFFVSIMIRRYVYVIKYSFYNLKIAHYFKRLKNSFHEMQIQIIFNVKVFVLLKLSWHAYYLDGL